MISITINDLQADYHKLIAALQFHLQIRLNFNQKICLQNARIKRRAILNENAAKSNLLTLYKRIITGYFVIILLDLWLTLSCMLLSLWFDNDLIS